MDTDSKEKKHESALDDLLEEAEALKRRSRASAGKRNKKPATANVINDIQENLQGISENISGFASFCTPSRKPPSAFTNVSWLHCGALSVP
jgi:hypothetical protein